MVRSAPVSLLRCLFLFAILLIFFTHTASAEGSDFEISEGSNWSLDYFDGNSLQSSGNESASDGDYLSLNIPVYNSNLSSNNAYWSFSFGNSGLWYGGHSGVLSGNQSISDVEVFFGPLDEGVIFCKLIINNTLNEEIITIRVGPNPVNFTSAGAANLVLLGQPAHVGDELIASILVHNQGVNTNSVQLELMKNDGTIIVLGDAVSISPGSSREVSASFTQLISGSQSIKWAILSSHGGVDTYLNGTSYLEIQESQEIVNSIEQMSWTLQEGLNLDVSISLSSGLNRSATVSVLMKSGNDYSLYQIFTVDLNPGIRNLNLDLGHPDASRLKLVVSADGWLSINGDAEVIIELSPPLIIPSIMITNVSPESVSVGDTVFINYILQNSGTERSSSGLLRVVAIANDAVFSERPVSAINGGSSVSGVIEITSWEYSLTTDIKFIWTMDELTTTNQTSIIIDSGSSTSFTLPFNIYAALYGALSGLAIVMASLVVFRVVSQNTPSTFSSLSRNKLPVRGVSNSLRPDEKKEVSCPSCSQRLNIPSTHEGLVKCPACTMQFSQSQSVEIKDKNSSPIPKVSDKTNNNSALESYSESDLLPCPRCEQTLRVPLDKRPIRSRCPACRAEFIAKLG